jgi:predicted nucleotidyltransferase
MEKQTGFEIFSSIAEKAGIKCVLIGGFAVNYYNFTRQTVDIDFLLTEEDFRKIKKSLEDAGYKQDSADEVFAKFSGKDKLLFDIDFMFVDKETLSKILKSSKAIEIAGKQFIVPCLNDLIALKLHSIKNNPLFREGRDLLDIINLVRLNNLDYKSDKFKELCLKYGSRDIYEKILKGSI